MDAFQNEAGRDNDSLLRASLTEQTGTGANVTMENSIGDVLVPIFITGGGRSGSTALMSRVGTDARVAFDRAYPFENRYLTYLVKFALSLEKPELFRYIEVEHLVNFDYLGFGGAIPGPEAIPAPGPHQIARPSLEQWVRRMWVEMSCAVKFQEPDKNFYAEKAPLWVPPIVRRFFPCLTVYNTRDPRDVYLSANAFNKKRKHFGFGRSAGDSDIDHARNIALGFLMCYEAYHFDRHRDDALLIRYEDFVCRRAQVLGELEDRAGLSLRNEDCCPELEFHRTTGDLASSVRRWEREPLPQGVSDYLEEHAGEEMEDLGYPLTARRRCSLRRLSFSEGRVNVKSIACSPDGELIPERDGCAVQVSGDDFWILLPCDSFSASDVTQVWVSLDGEIGDVVSLYWACDGQSGFAEERAIHLSYSPLVNRVVLPFRVSRHPDWKGIISHLRLDLFNARKKPHTGKGYLRWVQLAR